ncbi:CRISPR-associated helicase Cas3' [Myroides sp. WP-1]|uniref:CRISPR-associated helicase Cas3' n=1 Tax=Myroides sp. WP-1 TaxID=2759944 RepID=UPI0015F9E75A|nr:CRISPR-associated helicase Cas3' [Myroides sp. WP-1]MBB1139704.1 CRISPR-associated helicase Cas3' [Myroides sp. WP-1]
MSNLYKSTEKIVSELPSLQSYLCDEGIYYAHRDPKGVDQPETLVEHINLVIKYFLQLVNEHQLDAIIDGLIYNYLNEVGVENHLVGEEIKQQFINVICFHDHGKVNENFQADSTKMNNTHFFGKAKKDSIISTHHSSLGAFIFLGKALTETFRFGNQEKNVLMSTAYLLSYTIFKHHSSYLDDNIASTLEMSNILINRDREKTLNFMSTYFTKFDLDIKQEVVRYIGNTKIIAVILDQYCISDSLYSLLKLNFSLLTAADYLATNEYSSKCPIADSSVFSVERINQIYEYLTQAEYLIHDPSKVNFNAITYKELDTYKWINPKLQSGDNLNILRKEMGIEVIKTIRENLDKNLFYIEAPTGGGKTNLSILATMELLQGAKGKFNKVFYVFPFTTLITQTKDSIKETLGLDDNEIIELHSKAAFAEKTEIDGAYGKEKLNYISNLFVHYPVCLLTHIGFFDGIKSNRKDKNYLFHRLANSIVVIDELQSYNPSQWDKIIYLINHYAQALNIKFILMSATLPKLDRIEFLQKRVQEFVYLLPDSKEKYFKNPNFCERVIFDFEYFESKADLNHLASRLVSESKAYADFDYGGAKPKGSVYTIIEFIYKKSATDFYELFKDDEFFDEIFVLSGTILEHRRQYIISFLKDKENRNKKILLITTQVVEAGVDIDMDLGFKDRSLIDSDEQLAGRINRNVNKKNCKLFLFNYNKESVVYGRDLRYKFTKEKIKAEQYQEILKTKNFDLLYDLVINNRNKWTTTPMVENVTGYINHLINLRFQSVNDEFQLIENKNVLCFIPLKIPIKIGERDFFTKSELKFLKSYGILPTNCNQICGAQVFNLYINIIHNRIEFVSQKMREKRLNSILSKYVYAVFATEAIEKQLVHFSNVEKSQYGYQYMEHWKDFYTEEGGMDTSRLYGVEESQFL